MNPYELIKQKCDERHITVHKLETVLGFANGYIKRLTSPMINYGRAKRISDFLDIPLSDLIDEQIPAEEEKQPETPDFKPVMAHIEKEYGAGTAEAVKMLLELDSEDRAEIRGEMRAMLRNSGRGKE